MAEHATEYTHATGNDYAEHEGTYALMTKLAKLATATLVLVVISLAIGGVTGAWHLCGLGIVAALVSGVVGGMSEKGSVLPIVGAGVVLLGLWLLFG